MSTVRPGKILGNTVILAVLCIVLFVGTAATLITKYTLHRLDEHRKSVASLQRKDIQITIVEGKRREEIAQLLESAGICSAGEFLELTIGKEGYLFPDTYRFFANTPTTEVVNTLQNTFSRRTSDLNPSLDQIILASIVEREAVTDSEREIIAGVYQNRLRIGMKLDADPTVQYARDTQASKSASFTYWQPITRADYQGITSPYNTYQVAGLPPGPIANPGKKSIEAAISPQSHSYLYFFHRDNQLILSSTLSEHERKFRSIPR